MWLAAQAHWHWLVDRARRCQRDMTSTEEELGHART